MLLSNIFCLKADHLGADFLPFISEMIVWFRPFLLSNTFD